jgi:hypothetical protein
MVKSNTVPFREIRVERNKTRCHKAILKKFEINLLLYVVACLHIQTIGLGMIGSCHTPFNSQHIAEAGVELK